MLRSHSVPAADRSFPAGFTLVELLVVVAIIGVLVAMLLPAVQAARESGRRTACLNNLRQVGLAMKQYESHWESFPPAACVHNTASSTNAVDSNQPASEYDNWAIEILPFIGMGVLYDKFAHNLPISSNAGTTNASNVAISNSTARSVALPFMLCPTDTFNRRPFNGTSGGETVGFNDNWARGDYAANLGLGNFSPAPPWNADGPAAPGWLSTATRGVCGVNAAWRVADITDGLSSTILLGEIRAGVAAFDPRGVWAMANSNSILTCCGGCYGDDYGPNCNAPYADDVTNCTQIQNAAGGVAALQAGGMGCWDGTNDQQTARSLHSKGVNVCLCDGSARWISDFIQVMPSGLPPGGPLSIWDRLIASADGQQIPGNAF